MIKKTARLHSLADVISQRQDKKTIDTVKIGLKFRRSWVGSPEYTEWKEEAGTPVKYRTEDVSILAVHEPQLFPESEGRLLMSGPM